MDVDVVVAFCRLVSCYCRTQLRLRTAVNVIALSLLCFRHIRSLRMDRCCQCASSWCQNPVKHINAFGFSSFICFFLFYTILLSFFLFSWLKVYLDCNLIQYVSNRISKKSFFFREQIWSHHSRQLTFCEFSSHVHRVSSIWQHLGGFLCCITCVGVLHTYISHIDIAIWLEIMFARVTNTKYVITWRGA